MKRFYKNAEVVDQGAGFGVELDGKPVKTPAGRFLIADGKKLAEILTDEWRAQEKNILPDQMPANQIVITALDNHRVRAEIEQHILSYIDTDLLLYRSDVSPYKEQQEKTWTPLTQWFEKTHDVKIETTYDISALRSSEDVVTIFTTFVEKLDILQLILFESLVEEATSPILALAFFNGAASVDDTYQAILVDDLTRGEIYQEERYGAAPDQEKKRKSIRRNLEAAQKILSTFTIKE